MRRGSPIGILAVVLTAVLLGATACSDDPPRIVGLETTTSTSPDGAADTQTTMPSGPSTTTPVGKVQPVASAAPHIWVINLSTESYASTFGPDTQIPYLAKELTAQGAWLTQYHAVTHQALGNYIAQVSGQPPTDAHKADCPVFEELKVAATDEQGVVTGTGCVYPAAVPTVGGQLEQAGFTWRQYGEDMANGQRAGEATTCRHPAIGRPDGTAVARPGDMYATRHIGFAYFRSVIDDPSCSSHLADLRAMPGDLATVDATPNVSFIAPNLCNSGHDSPCIDGSPGGMAAADAWLRAWVPTITASPAYQKNGILIVTFDQAEADDTTGCCGQEVGGGRVGAVVLGPKVTPGSIDPTPYNHYSLLCSLENAFGLPRLALAAAPDLACFISPAGGGAASKA